MSQDTQSFYLSGSNSRKKYDSDFMMNISTIYIKACVFITSSSSLRGGTILLSDQVEVEEDTVIQNVPIERLNFKVISMALRRLFLAQRLK